MTPEQKRSTIAKACGWKNINPDGTVQKNNYSYREMTGWHPTLPGPVVPYYLDSLGAMQYAESMLSPDESDRMTGHLLMILGQENNKASIKAFTALRRATASQRADAFIQTLNLI
jgi:hypothetical protein